jgi:hypothetical protein
MMRSGFRLIFVLREILDYMSQYRLYHHESMNKLFGKGWDLCLEVVVMGSALVRG